MEQMDGVWPREGSGDHIGAPLLMGRCPLSLRSGRAPPFLISTRTAKTGDGEAAALQVHGLAVQQIGAMELVVSLASDESVAGGASPVTHTLRRAYHL
ncbi:hypothetical protein NDU88_003386 [Pleurodeles waltl]|uniref:Uncharacterized protein n=1 Tax=Pleurodeles waltl TaxID=8319 RepID=A0AAV7MQK4_PLEWA|nr:hypothetical protein NDU88_003386 [Pleurodeles waltl]